MKTTTIIITRIEAPLWYKMDAKSYAEHDREHPKGVRHSQVREA